MSDEIKEILDKAKEISGYGSDGKQHTRVFNQFEAKALLDYITNLQSKIDKANQYLEERFIFDDENGEYYQTHTFDKDNAKELHDILKENNNEC